MGGIEEKGSFESYKNNTSLLEESIIRANSISETDLFFYKESVYINFRIQNKTFSKKIIADFYMIESQVRKNLKQITMDIKEFYTFYNTLMDAKNIILGDSIKAKMKTKKGDDEDDEADNEFCPICSANKVEIMLDCSHFFCEKCIKTWLFDKKNTCPLCRNKVDLQKVKIKESEKWNFLDTQELQKIEMESAERLQKMILEYLN